MGGEEQPKNNVMTVAKTAPVTFPAHRALWRVAQAYLQNCVNHMVIVQLQFLSRASHHTVSDDDMKSHAKELVDAANRFIDALKESL